MNSRATRAASDESDFKLAEGEWMHRHAGTSIRHLITLVGEGRHPVQDAGNLCGSLGSLRREPSGLREDPADFSQHPAGDAEDSEALFCITKPFTGNSAESLLQQRSVALHQKSSAQELAKVDLHQDNLAWQPGKAFPVAQEGCLQQNKSAGCLEELP
jgi:hypothetical protein